MTHNYLFIFTISPVQSFIAQARKTQDLYAGSQILSQLTKKAIETIGEDNVIFPNTKDLEKAESLPNRLVARFEGTVEQAKSKGQEIEIEVLNEFRKLANAALSNAKVSFQIDDWDKDITTETSLQKAFKQQIDKHLEMSWLFQPYTEGGYQETFKLLEEKLGAIKNVRQFKQFTYDATGNIGEKGRKCSLDGERNALFFGKGTNTKYYGLGSKWNPEAEVIIKLDPNEGLSAVSFAKRFFKDTNGEVEKFPSTALITLNNTLCQINSNVKDDFKKVFGKGNILYQVEKEGCLKLDGQDWVDWDDQFYYEENLNKKNVPCQAQLNLAKKEYSNLAKVVKDKELKFDRYYALLTFDGDNMGAWLSGDKTPTIDLNDFHSKLSKCLADFAKNIQLEEPKGKTVYAGGDDFLGFVNLDNLFDVLSELKKEFDEQVNQVLKREFSITENLNFSAGVAIAHYKTPLNLVLNNARRILEKAKNSHTDKNALGISVLKHSGRDHDICLKWDKGDIEMSQLKHVVESLKTEFSSKWIYSFAQEFTLFTDDNQKKIKSEHREMVREEIGRLLSRAYKIQDGHKRDKVDILRANVHQLMSKLDYHFSDITELLSIADFIATKNDR